MTTARRGLKIKVRSRSRDSKEDSNAVGLTSIEGGFLVCRYNEDGNEGGSVYKRTNLAKNDFGS